MTGGNHTQIKTFENLWLPPTLLLGCARWQTWESNRNIIDTVKCCNLYSIFDHRTVAESFNCSRVWPFKLTVCRETRKLHCWNVELGNSRNLLFLHFTLVNQGWWVDSTSLILIVWSFKKFQLFRFERENNFWRKQMFGEDLFQCGDKKKLKITFVIFVTVQQDLTQKYRSRAF